MASWATTARIVAYSVALTTMVVGAITTVVTRNIFPLTMAGLAIMVAGYLVGVVAAFRHSPARGIACLLLPPIVILLAALDTDDTVPKGPVWLIVVGGAVVFLGPFIVPTLLSAHASNSFGPWPDSELAPASLVTLDLSELGLSASEPEALPVEEPCWPEASAVSFARPGETEWVVQVVAIKFSTPRQAGECFAHATIESCGAWNRHVGDTSGLLECDWSDAAFRAYWHDTWVVNFTVKPGETGSASDLATRVRSSLLAHWSSLPGPTE